jgi:transcription initiation factor TFIID TATA-box-binding protein
MESVEYEPEQFSALMFRESDYTILLFSSGKIICTGVTTFEDVTNAIDEFESQIRAV